MTQHLDVALKSRPQLPPPPKKPSRVETNTRNIRTISHGSSQFPSPELIATLGRIWGLIRARTLSGRGQLFEILPPASSSIVIGLIRMASEQRGVD